MISLSKIKSTVVEQGRRIAKVFQYGAKTAVQAAPFGDDSNPIADMVAIYADTDESGDQVILGYINKNAIAAPGEKRIFSVDSNGNVQTFIHLKNDGTILIGGEADNAVRYAALNTQLQSLITQLNGQLTAISTGIAGAGGTYTPTPVNVDFSSARINEVKTQ